MNRQFPSALVLFVTGIYLIASLLVGYLARKRFSGSTQFLHAHRSLPTAVTAIAFLAANCGALEIVGIVAASAKYGVLALHFYLIGAVPAMVFLAIFMIPVYVGSGAMTVLDFLRVRYNRATHILGSLSLALMMVFISGIALYAISIVLQSFWGLQFLDLVTMSAAFVLGYILIGGLYSTIYNQVLQFGLTLVGLVPLMCAVFLDFHGTAGMRQQLPQGMMHLWTALPLMQPKLATMDIVGIVFGLGFILSFGYWCTDFVLIQRALAAKTSAGSINTPLFAAIAKMVFPCLIIYPGIAAAIFLRQHNSVRYDLALPFLMQRYYGPVLLSLGICGIVASLMSGLAGNINAFSSLLTHDLYRQYIRPDGDDSHYLYVGRICAVLATCMSVGTAYVAFRYNNLMDYLQLLFSLFNAPLFATFFLGMFTTWATPSAGFWGLLGGIAVTGSYELAVRFGLISFGSQMSANFYGAILGWSVCAALTAAISILTKAKTKEELRGITYFTRGKAAKRISVGSWALALSVLAICIVLNFIFR